MLRFNVPNTITVGLIAIMAVILYGMVQDKFLPQLPEV